MADISGDFRELVYARIQSMPNDTKISIGGADTLSKTELLTHIADNDEIGMQMIEIEMEFFKALKEGDLYKHEE